MKQLMLKIETIVQSSSGKKKKRNFTFYFVLELFSQKKKTLFLNSHKLAFIEEC